VPTNIVRTAAQEKAWTRAKKIASEDGHAANYAYINAIYHRMVGKSAGGVSKCIKVSAAHAYLRDLYTQARARDNVARAIELNEKITDLERRARANSIGLLVEDIAPSLRAAITKASLGHSWNPRRDGSSGVGLFMRLPAHLAALFPSLAPEDTSPTHITVLYVGSVPEHRSDEFYRIVTDCFLGVEGDDLTLGALKYFYPEAFDVAYSEVHVSGGGIEGARLELVRRLRERGFEVSGRGVDDWHPHATLAYLPKGERFHGSVPEGTWRAGEIEIWGMPDHIIIPLIPPRPRHGRATLAQDLLKAYKYKRRWMVNGKWRYDYGDGQPRTRAPKADGERKRKEVPPHIAAHRARAEIASGLDRLRDGFVITTPEGGSFIKQGDVWHEGKELPKGATAEEETPAKPAKKKPTRRRKPGAKKKVAEKKGAKETPQKPAKTAAGAKESPSKAAEKKGAKETPTKRGASAKKKAAEKPAKTAPKKAPPKKGAEDKKGTDQEKGEGKKYKYTKRWKVNGKYRYQYAKGQGPKDHKEDPHSSGELVPELIRRGAGDSPSAQRNAASAWLKAFAAFIQGAVPGKDRQWEMRFDWKQEQKTDKTKPVEETGDET